MIQGRQGGTLLGPGTGSTRRHGGILVPAEHLQNARQMDQFPALLVKPLLGCAHFDTLPNRTCLTNGQSARTPNPGAPTWSTKNLRKVQLRTGPATCEMISLGRETAVRDYKGVTHEILPLSECQW